MLIHGSALLVFRYAGLGLRTCGLCCRRAAGYASSRTFPRFERVSCARLSCGSVKRPAAARPDSLDHFRTRLGASLFSSFDFFHSCTLPARCRPRISRQVRSRHAVLAPLQTLCNLCPVGLGLFPGEAFSAPFPAPNHGFMGLDPSRHSLRMDDPHLNIMPPPSMQPLYPNRDPDSLEEKLGRLALNPRAKEFVPPKGARGPEVSQPPGQASVLALFVLSAIY